MSTTTTKKPPSTGRKKRDRSKQVLAKDKTILERLKKKLDLRLNERDSMSKRYELLIRQQSKGPRKTTATATASVDREYQDLTRRINRIRAEILSLEGGVITEDVLPYLQRGQFGLKQKYTQGEDQHAKVYDYKVGDLYFNDKISSSELAIIKKTPNRLPKGTEFNLGDTAEGGEMSQEMEDRTLSSNFYQQLQIKNNESKLNRTSTNGTF
tara:strand:+ start:113 stop:745 length:633 start_codon:yes stop_codon:yes gene_type:complete